MNVTFDLQTLKDWFHKPSHTEATRINIYSDPDNILKVCRVSQKRGKKIQIKLYSGAVRQVFVQKVLGKQYIIAEERRFPWFRFSMIAFHEINSVSTDLTLSGRS